MNGDCAQKSAATSFAITLHTDRVGNNPKQNTFGMARLEIRFVGNYPKYKKTNQFSVATLVSTHREAQTHH